MNATKARLSASVDADLVASAESAVAAGRAPSVSAWVNDALRLKREQDERLDRLQNFVATFEAEHGLITPKEMQAAARRARARAIVVRPPPKDAPRSAARRRSAVR